MNTQLKQALISEIDDSVSKGYFATEEEAVEKALFAIREKEIMSKIEFSRQQEKEGQLSPFKGIAEEVNNRLRQKLETNV
jgi:Arc/MetJ-type ribon-helix-helix transcriptional regulator